MTTPDQGTGGAGAAPPSLADLYVAHSAACNSWARFATRTHAAILDDVTHELHRAIDRERPEHERVGRHLAVDMAIDLCARAAMLAAIERVAPIPDYAPDIIRALHDAGFEIKHTPRRSP